MNAGGATEPVPLWLWPWCLFLFLIPFQSTLDGLTLSLGYNLLGLSAGVMLALANRRQSTGANFRVVAVAFLLLALCFSYFFSLDTASTREALTPVGATAIVYVLATITPLSMRQLEMGMRAWLWGGATAAVCAMLAFMHGATGVDGRATLLLAGTETDPNFLIASLLVPYALCLHFLTRPDRRIEALAAGSTLVGITLLSESRSGMLGLLTVTLCALAWKRRWKSLLAVVLLLVGAYAAFSPELGRFDLSSDPTGAGRTEIWHAAIKAGTQHLATGIGLGALPTVCSSYPGLYWDRDAHNTYVQAFAEAGLPGMLALVAVFAAHLFGRARHPLAFCVRSSLIALLVTGMFLHMLTFKLLWATWMVAAQAETAISRHSKRPFKLQATVPPARIPT